MSVLGAMSCLRVLCGVKLERWGREGGWTKKGEPCCDKIIKTPKNKQRTKTPTTKNQRQTHQHKSLQGHLGPRVAVISANSCANISSLVGRSLFSESIADASSRVLCWAAREIIPEHRLRSLKKEALP